MTLSTATLSTASDPLPIGEYVTDATRNTSYIITAFDEGLHANSRSRSYEAVAADGSACFLLHEGLALLDLAGTLTLSERLEQKPSPYLARLLPMFEMGWFDRVIRYYVPEVVAPDLMSVAWLNQQPKRQWEIWFEQLVEGLDILHSCGVAFRLTDEDAVMRHIGVNSAGAHWRNLGALVLLEDEPEAAYADVRALCAALAHTRLVDAQSHVRYALRRAADPHERINAAMLLSGLRRVKADSAHHGDGLEAELGHATSTGMVRADNEDSVCAIEITTGAAGEGQPRRKPILLAVADGMGGVEAGEVASELAIRALTEAAQQLFASGKKLSPAEINAWVQRTVKDINNLIVAEGERRGNQMGATLAFALVVDGKAYLGNVGDSRIYLWRSSEDSPLIRLSKDHSLVQSLVDAGLLRDEDRYTHPERSLIYRSLGDPKTGISDAHEPVPLQPGDWLMVCSDGLWEMVRDEAMRDVLIFSSNAQIACDRLVDLANANGGEDNIAVAIGKFL
ncbi:MAG: protein phosphatase 2C domain-containing protein [Thermoflexales bacterium]|nr:protein phosphatase 2C domain-containing protein [Thermoflexales bacterium]MDW8350717.1 protein phosphatase 2C domain-containing protein [Anaerolineae bacterium]